MAKFDVEVQLSGENGNVFAIIGRVTRALRRADIDESQINDFRQECMSGDYDHVLQTCMKWVEVV